MHAAVFLFGGPRMCALAGIHAERAGWSIGGTFADAAAASRAASAHAALTMVLDAGCLLDAAAGAPEHFRDLGEGTAIDVDAKRGTGERVTTRAAARIAQTGHALREPARRERAARPCVGTWCAGIAPRDAAAPDASAPRLTSWLPILGMSGYAVAARNLALGMRNAGVNIVVPYLWNDEPVATLEAVEDAMVAEMQQPARPSDPALIYRPVTSLNGGPFFDSYRSFTHAPLIGCAMFETDELPGRWPGALARCDAVWVPSSGGRDIFVRSGVPEDRLSVVPIGIDVGRFFPDGTRMALDSRRTVFLSVFEWGSRKGTDVLLAAWARAFGPDDDVALFLRTGSRSVDGNQAVAELLLELGIDRSRCAPIVVLPDAIPDRDWASLYRGADAFVLTSRGEGFCIPYLEAMAAGIPVIGTAYEGAGDLLNDATGIVIPSRLNLTDDALAARVPLYTKLRWLEPDIDATAVAMQAVRNAPGAAAQRAATAFARAHQIFDRDVVGELAARTLAGVTRRTQCEAPAAFTLSGDVAAMSDEGEATRSLLRVAQAAGVPVAMVRQRADLVARLDGYDEDRIADAYDRDPSPRHVRVGSKPDTVATIRYLATVPDTPDGMRSIAAAAAVWVTTNAIARGLRAAGIPANRIFVIPLNVDVPRFGPDARTTVVDASRTFFMVPLDFNAPGWEAALAAVLDALLGEPGAALSIMLLNAESDERNSLLQQSLQRLAAGKRIAATIGAITVPDNTARGLIHFNAHQVIVNMPGLPPLVDALAASAGLANVAPDAIALRRALFDRRMTQRAGRLRRQSAMLRSRPSAVAADFRDALDEQVAVDRVPPAPRENDLLIVVIGTDDAAARRTAAVATAHAALPVTVLIAARIDRDVIAAAPQRYVAQIPAGSWIGYAWDLRLVSELRRSLDIDAIAAISVEHTMFAHDIRNTFADPATRQQTAFFVLLMAPPQKTRLFTDVVRADGIVVARTRDWHAIQRIEIDTRTLFGQDRSIGPVPEVVIASGGGTGAAAPADGAVAVQTRLLWRGDFLPNHSIARVNRMLAAAMIACDEIDVVAQGEPTVNVEKLLALPVRRIEDCAPVATTFALKHMWPPSYRSPKDGLSIHIQPYEYGALPLSWLDPTLKRADDVWCYTEYVRRQYIEAGVPPERTCVIPLGFDPAVYHPDVKPAEIGSATKFVFLFVGGTIWRKGIDVLLDAYLATFTPADDVVLIVKAFGNATFYATQNSSDRIMDLAKRSDVPMVRYGDADMTDSAMAELYRRADVLMQPYRGEGFGLPVLEAMACGTPPIVTLGGATDDFVTDAIGYRVPAKRIDLGTDFAQDVHVKPCWALEPEVDALARYMRYAFENRDEVRARGAKAAAYVRERFTWSHAARRALDRLAELSPRTPLARDGEDERLNDFEQQVLAPTGEDGIVIELFSRLRFADPLLVEFAPGSGFASTGATLAKLGGWKAVMIEPDATRAAEHRTAYANHPLVQSLHAADDPATARAVLDAHGVPDRFDLLSITTAHALGGLWDAIESRHPRVVVVRHDGDSAADASETLAATATGRRLGYAYLGADLTGTRLFFVRRDLLAHTGFPER